MAMPAQWCQKGQQPLVVHPAFGSTPSPSSTPAQAVQQPRQYTEPLAVHPAQAVQQPRQYTEPLAVHPLGWQPKQYTQPLAVHPAQA
jgi:hypothetical protein